MTDAPVALRPARPLRAALVAPRSIGLLLLAVVLAATFAALAQWQIGRAVQNGTVAAAPDVRTVALADVARPGTQQTVASIGRLVSASGRFVPRDVRVVGDRLNRGRHGWWVVGHAVLDAPAGAQLAVGIGWTADRAAADRAAASLRAAAPADLRLDGRYVDSDAAEPSTSGSPGALTEVSAARLLNLWDPAFTGPTYEGVLTLRSAPAGLDTIYSPTPQEQVELNLLNVGYAVEWVLFALAAFYVWYRLVRDRWELEQQTADAPGGADPHD